jgi:hypothetical protein
LSGSAAGKLQVEIDNIQDLTEEEMDNILKGEDEE